MGLRAQDVVREGTGPLALRSDGTDIKSDILLIVSPNPTRLTTLRKEAFTWKFQYSMLFSFKSFSIIIIYPLWWPRLTKDLQTELKKVLCVGVVRQTRSAWFI